ncbi:SDR family NA [Sesbania bispinosa]|nr:SDR family NA [Sesbania bispinosa]
MRGPWLILAEGTNDELHGTQGGTGSGHGCSTRFRRQGKERGCPTTARKRERRDAQQSEMMAARGCARDLSLSSGRDGARGGCVNWWWFMKGTGDIRHRGIQGHG